MGLPWWLRRYKESAGRAGDLSSILGSERSPGEGNGYLLQYSCLENPMDRGAWWAIVHGGGKESDTTEQLTLLLPLEYPDRSADTIQVAIFIIQIK